LELELRHIENDSWIALVFLGVFILLTLTKAYFPRRFSEFIQLPVTDKYFSLEGKKRTVNQPFNILIFIIQTLCISLFLLLIIKVESPQKIALKPVWLLQIWVGFIVFVSFKFYLEKLIAHILDIEAVVENYLFERLSYASLIGLFLGGISLLFYFSFSLSKSLFYTIAGIAALLYLISLISSIKRNQQTIFKGFFYFILYLCALEIAPYVILYKVLV
tara:strand:+ start:30948 stop:31601 length:654 start_codon:yes stop_codon:yes gene_type:complete